ncbi:MAG TPA: HD domain-containing phosphohydrolase [Alphaproteobacteria bacterium]|nr:HD domain-containing phosphohydrolase [Alphaproteobacteria bacterium]
MARTFSRYSLPTYVAALFLTLLLIFAGVLITWEYQATKNMLLSATTTLFDRIGGEVRSAVRATFSPARRATSLIATTSLVEGSTLEARMRGLPILVQALRTQTDLAAAYVGYDDGDFFLVRPFVPGGRVERTLAAPEGTSFFVQSMSHEETGPHVGRYLYLDDRLRILANRLAPDYEFDPRPRPWYQAAHASDAVQVTDPYMFFTTREIGVTVAKRSEDGHAVVAVDLGLSALRDILRDARPTAGAELMIFNGTGEVIAQADPGHRPAVDELGAPVLQKAAEVAGPILASLAKNSDQEKGRVRAVEDADGNAWQGYVAPLKEPGTPLFLAVAVPQAQLLTEARRIRNEGLLIALLVLAAAVPATFVVSRLASRPLKALTAEAHAVQTLRFDEPVAVRSAIAEIDTLAGAMGAMKSTISQLLSIGAVLANERSFDRLIGRILEETIRIASARGGVIYLAEPEGKLSGALSRWDGVVRERRPDDIDPAQASDHPAIRAAREGSLRIMLTPADLARWYPRFEHRTTLATYIVPLKNRQAQLVGVLLLAQDADTFSEAGHEDVMALVEAVSGTAAVALESQRLLLEQKRLLEAFIQLVAGAIDAKSPYTGGHCQRVPELTKMLARAAERMTEGPFKDFALSEEEWEELHIAAWLHDCGKVTTPEYVVDKATKLETVYDRLHEVRMRFEVIKCQAEAAYWKSVAEGEDRAAGLAELQALWRTLDEEFAFVARCNEGGESMAQKDLVRLREIAKRQWTRTLDDRIGLSHEEQERKARTPALPLPVREPLLADRPEHIFEREARHHIAEDNPWGFKLHVPKHLYNRGELHNLSVFRGTLTPEDRYKINEHMVETIRMLSSLPLPRTLRNVVEIACGHHEKMDGTGYPRRLKRDEMSWAARMMAIADIFEALTAVDRPYKRGKTLSESFAIMAQMRDSAHIDPDVFELFLKGGVYREYAERFLAPEQIDAVEPEKFLRAG